MPVIATVKQIIPNAIRDFIIIKVPWNGKWTNSIAHTDDTTLLRIVK